LEPVLDEVEYCNKTFKNHFNKPIDHDHVTSAFRLAAHEICNPNYKLTEKCQ